MSHKEGEELSQLKPHRVLKLMSILVVAVTFIISYPSQQAAASVSSQSGIEFYEEAADEPGENETEPGPSSPDKSTSDKPTHSGGNTETDKFGDKSGKDYKYLENLRKRLPQMGEMLKGHVGFIGMILVIVAIIFKLKQKKGRQMIDE